MVKYNSIHEKDSIYSSNVYYFEDNQLEIACRAGFSSVLFLWEYRTLVPLRINVFFIEDCESSLYKQCFQLYE